MDIRRCAECNEHIPPETDHYYDSQDDKTYHLECLEATPYTAYTFYDKCGNYVGDSEFIDKVESYEDIYEEE